MTSPAASQRTNRIQVRAGRPYIRTTHIAMPSNGNQGDKRHPELARAVRFSHAQNQNPDADQHESKQRADVGELHDLVDVGDGGEEGDEDAGQNRGDVRRPVSGMDFLEPRAQEAVARHAHQDAGLAQLKHQQHGGHGDHGAQGQSRPAAQSWPT